MDRNNHSGIVGSVNTMADLQRWDAFVTRLTDSFSADSHEDAATHAYGAVMAALRAGQLPEQDREDALYFADRGFFDRRSAAALRKALKPVAA